jgi:hypothetical protein
MKNLKLEKKYLEMIIKYDDGRDALMAKGRLDALNLK